jgi:hypothetical protein
MAGQLVLAGQFDKLRWSSMRMLAGITDAETIMQRRNTQKKPRCEMERTATGATECH